MQRYFLKLSYKGTNYHGWQVQPNAITVQEVLNTELRKCTQDQNINVVGCGRTDTGVHASEFFAHFESETEIQVNSLAYRLNKMLPRDIAIKSAQKVDSDQHARFSAKARTYHYNIHFHKSPFLTETSWYVQKPLNFEKMNEACEVLFNYQDFTSFSKLHTEAKTNNCKIMRAEWIGTENGIQLALTADRFLRNMVRAIVGTMVEVGLGKITVEDFRKVIESKDRGEAGMSVPAQGLFLTKIEYPFL